jgi:hypothetical protein
MNCYAQRQPNNANEVNAVYFMKEGSPRHMRWLRVFEPLMVVTGSRVRDASLFPRQARGNVHVQTLRLSVDDTRFRLFRFVHSYRVCS